MSATQGNIHTAIGVELDFAGEMLGARKRHKDETDQDYRAMLIAEELTKPHCGISGARLSSFIKRIEKLNEEKEAIGEDLKEVYAEAKGTGYDTKIIRQLVRMRKEAIEKLRENDELLSLYMSAIGMEI